MIRITTRLIPLAALAGMLLLSACGAAGISNAPASSATTTSVLAANPVGSEAGGEGGVEAALVTYADAAQGFAIGHPGPWTQDMSVKDGVQFNGGDDHMRLQFATLPAGTDVLTYAAQDAPTFGGTLSNFKQVGIAPSAEVANAVVLGFETTSTSVVTGKSYTTRGDRYYMPLANGRLAILTVVGPNNHYDREGVRDIALTFTVTT